MNTKKLDDLRKLPYDEKYCGWPAKAKDIPDLFKRRFGYKPKIAYRYGNTVYVRVEQRREL